MYSLISDKVSDKSQDLRSGLGGGENLGGEEACRLIELRIVLVNHRVGNNMKAMQPPQTPNFMFEGLDPQFNHLCMDNMSSAHSSLPLSASHVLIARQSRVSGACIVLKQTSSYSVSQRLFLLA